MGVLGAVYPRQRRAVRGALIALVCAAPPPDLRAASAALDSGANSRIDTGRDVDTLSNGRTSSLVASCRRMTPCPDSGSPGHAITLRTIKALLTDTALRRLTTSTYRFCPDPGCDVVYFGADGTRFATADVRVGVGQKLPFGMRPLCYCFGESDASIRAEIDARGRSFAVERIRDHIAHQRCACDIRSPRGVCCLGEVAAAIARIRSER
jgi:hypothetical protein